MMVLERSPEAIRAASLRPVQSRGWKGNLLLLLFAVPVLAALAAWGYQIFAGLGVTGLNNRVFWGVYTANLVTFIGLSYGGALVSAILRLVDADWRAPITRMAEATALVTLLIGSVFVFVHVGRVDRLWEFFTRPQGSSPLIWDAAAISTYLVATLIFLYLPLIPDLGILARYPEAGLSPRLRRFFQRLSLGWSNAERQERVLEWGMTVMAVLIIPLAVGVHSVLSWAFALTTREGWHSSIFGPYFVVAALYSGVAAVILVVAAFRKGYGLESFIGPRHFRNLGYLLLVLNLAYLYMTFADLLTETYPLTEGAGGVLELLLVTRYAPYFWAFIVGGSLLPAFLTAWPWRRPVAPVVVAAALAVAGLWLKRLLIVVPPQVPSLIEGPLGSYTPSWVEWTITLGAVSAIPLFLLLFFRFFPVLSVWELEQAAALERTPSKTRGSRNLSA